MRRSAILDFRIIVAKEMLLLPLVGLLADEAEPRCDHMPSLSPPAVAKIAMQEFRFRPKVILSQRLGIGLELIRGDRAASFAIECRFRGFADIPIERGDRLWVRLLPRPPSRGRRQSKFVG